MPHGSLRKKKLILSSDYFLAFTTGRFETAPQVCPMLYMHVLVRKCPFNGCVREVLSSYKTSLFYLSKFAIRRLAPLFHVKSEEGDFTARKQQKWTTCKECHHNTKFPSRYMVKTNKEQEFTYSVLPGSCGALTNSGNNILLRH